MSENLPRAVIFTASEVEYLAVREHLEKLEERVHTSGTNYEQGTFVSDGGVWQVVVAQIGARGPRAAAEEERVLDTFTPSVAFFVGVAVGLKYVGLGDVVASTKVYAYEPGKGDGTFRHRPEVGNSSYALVERARAEARSEEWRRRIRGGVSQGEPRIFVGAMAVGEKVVASSRSPLWQFLRQSYADVLAVEMEGRGFLKALHAYPEIKALVILGISDLVDEKVAADASGSQEVAARHASAFAFEVMSLGGVYEAEPSYSDDESRKLSQALEDVYALQEQLTRADHDTTAVEEEILALKRRLREGGSLKAGDYLADGRFRLLDILGKGGFSTVWKAFDRIQCEVVALKILHGQSAQDRTLRERFFRGARKMAELHHRGIVRVLESRVEEGEYQFFAMEYVAGGDLRQTVLGGRLAAEDGLRVICQVAEALHFAHQRGVIHRDVKPANILLDEGGAPKLTDFDLARAFGDTLATRTSAMGTILYASPEGMADARETDVRADVYSLAMTAVFLLHGRDLPLNVIRDLQSFVARLDCSQGVKDALIKAGAWRREDRFASALEFSSILEQHLSSPSRPLTPEVAEMDMQARRYIHAGNYREGRDLLRLVLNSDPSWRRRVLDEFQFLQDLGVPIEGKEFEPPVYLSARGRWRQRLWSLLAYGNDFPLGGQTTEETASDDSEPPAKPSEGTVHPQQKGETLERAVVDVFRALFTIGEEEEQYVCDQLRRQSAGSQGGYDLRFSFKQPLKVLTNERVRCRVECKDLTRHITVDHVGGKLLLTDDTAQREEIDHWILISPHSRPSNDLRELLDSWQKKDKFPFNVEIWSTDEGIEELFGLVPEVYEHYWPDDPLALAPRTWSDGRRERVRMKWLELLGPHLRLPDSWKRYLLDHRWLRMAHEPTDEELQDVFAHHVLLSCTDKSGQTAGSVEDQVKRWLSSSKPDVLFLIGEFGDGKTYQSYLLGRRLHEQFLEDPDSGVITVRFPLRDYDAQRGPQAFLESRLRQFGATLDEWITVCRSHRVLAVLDGFDEMSVPLDRQSVAASITQLEECVKKLQSLNPETSLKVLITSRPHFFANSRDERRLFSRLGNPVVFQLAPIASGTVWDNLHHFAKTDAERSHLRRLGELNDPIGLASKPLYLQMVKATLKTGTHEPPERPPRQSLDGVSLYDDYVRDVLTRKQELLDDQYRETLPDEVVEGLESILEAVAVALQTSENRYVLLGELVDSSDQGLAHLLWRAAFEATSPAARDEEDAMARIGVRSLLSPLLTDDRELREKWPVDFCHRSMREYFVARALAKDLLRSPAKARQLLRSARLTREVIDFTGVLLQRNWTAELDAVLREMIGAGIQEPTESRLGGNAASLLYASKQELPGDDWSGLRLDYADLAGADLSGKCFRGSSLRHARLDNAVMDGSDFRHCDLTGVVIEQTAAVRALLPQPRETVAVYTDGSLRAWRLRGGRDTFRTLPLAFGTPVRAAGLGPGGAVWATVGEDFVVSTWESQPGHAANGCFRLDPMCGGLDVVEDRALVFKGSGSEWRALIVDLDRYELLRMLRLEEEPICWSLCADSLIAMASASGVCIASHRDSNADTWLPLEGVSSLAATTARRSGPPLIAIGDRSGTVRIFGVRQGGVELDVVSTFEERLHEGGVSAVGFVGETTLLSGGVDRTVCVVDLQKEGEGLRAIRHRRLHRTLACRGLQTEGIVPENVRRKLEEWRTG